MAKAVDFDTTQEIEDLMEKALKIKRKDYDPSFDRKNIIWRKRNLKVFTEKSWLTEISVLWATLTTIQKTAWETAGAVCNLTGYQLFTQDTSYRLENSLSGVATPNNIYQYKVIHVYNANANWYLSFSQCHRESYDLFIKNPNQKNAYTPTPITENFVPPLKVEFYYKADLTPNPAGNTFHVTVCLVGMKDGVRVTDYQNVELNPSTDWIKFSQDFNLDVDYIYYYYVTIYMFKYTGEAFFDNFNIEHDSQNFAINPSCDDIFRLAYIHLGFKYYAWEQSGGGGDSYFRNDYL